jgi:hypothetical protein
MLLGAQAEGIKFGNPDLRMELPRLNSENVKYGIVYYDYVKMLGLWEKVFGADNITVAVFQKSQLLEGNVVLDFCERMLGAPPDSAARSYITSNLSLRENKRYSAEALYVLSKLNEIARSDPKTNRELISAVDTRSNSVLIKPSILEGFYKMFATSNREIAQKYLQRNELFDSTDDDFEYFDFENINNQVEALTCFMSKVVAKYAA